MEAGRRALGDEAFSVPGFPFWLATESRPFMRAMAGLAQVLEMQGRVAEAADVQAEMLRLNPGDNQGIRYQHVPVLIELGRLDAARAVLESKEYREDGSALWGFAGALVAFKQGRTDDAKRLLDEAMGRNPFVAPYLLDPDLMPPGTFAGWTPGDESEAAMVADLLGDVWGADEAAMEWLETTHRPAPRKRAAKSKSAKPRTGKPKAGKQKGRKPKQ
jgi:tetratricopeptide (TPR) repeat protein